MKILFVTDYFQPGFPYSKEILAKQMQQFGHTVRVVTSDRYFPFPNYDQTARPFLGERIQQTGTRIEDGIEVIRKKATFELFSRVFFREIHDEIDAFNPDKIFVFGAASPSAIAVSTYLQLRNIPLILVDSHLPSELANGGLVTRTAKRVLYWLFRQLFAPQISAVVTHIVAQQDATKQVISNYYGLTASILVIPNGTDTELFRFDSQAGKKLRKQLGIPEKDFVVLYTGKIIPAKGVHILTKAFSEVHKQVSNAWCVLVGAADAEYLEFCRVQLSSSAQKLCIFTGLQKPAQLPAYYSAADVAVWPLQESFAMNDAAASSLVFIANDTMGDKTRISSDNALLYKKGDAADLARKLLTLYHHPTKRRAMGRRGRKLAENKLSWHIITQQFLEIK